MKNVRLAILLSVMLAMLLNTAAFAEGSMTDLVDATAALLWNTDNVTAKAEAEFSLDGTLFKKYAVTHTMVGNDFCRDLTVTTPRADGTDKISGYVILANSEWKAVYDRYWQQVSRWSRYGKRDSILRRSVAADSYLSLYRGLATLLEGTLPEGAVNCQDNVWTIALEPGEAPEAVNAALMLAIEQVGSFKNWIDYRVISPDGYGDIEDYDSPAEGIAYCTASAKLEQLHLTVTMDDEGRLSVIEGTMAIWLNTRTGTEHLLSIALKGSASAYGTSVLPENAIPLDRIIDSQREGISSYLTEVYSYDPAEADAFVIGMDDGRIICYHPDHPEWKYEWSDGVLFTPFLTDYVNYPGEGCARGYLSLVKENNWLANLDDSTKGAMQTWLYCFSIIPNDDLLKCLQYHTDSTAEQFIESFFTSCYGPMENWSDPVKQWFDSVIAQYANASSPADLNSEPAAN